VFDCVSREKLCLTMMDMEYTLYLFDLLAKLYRKQIARVKAAGTRQQEHGRNGSASKDE